MIPLLIPRQRHLFRVEFFSNVDELTAQQDTLRIIQRSVVSIDLGTEMLLTGDTTTRAKRFIAWLMDDLDSALGRAIRELQLNPLPFTTIVSLLNQNGQVRERFVYVDCTADALQHSLLSHEPATADHPNADKSMKLLQFGFDHLEHEFF